MKKIKTILAVFLTILVAASCKKENDTNAEPGAGPKLISIKYQGTNFEEKFTYNSEGRLSTKVNTHYTMKYNFNASPFSCETFKADHTKVSDIIDAIKTGSRITGFIYRDYNSNGGFGDDTTSIQYDAAGYETGKKYSGYIYENIITNGNTTHVKETDDDNSFTRTTTLEYYNDKVNKLNLNLFEYFYQNQILNDHELMGRKNANLPKKMTYVSSLGNVTVSEFSYVMNAAGLPSQMTIIETPVGGAAKTTLIDFTYQ